VNRRPEGARGPGHATTLTPKELFAGFFAIGVQGFGGVLFWARRVLVEERRWLTAVGVGGCWVMRG